MYRSLQGNQKMILIKDSEILLTRKQRRQAQSKGNVVGRVMDRDDRCDLGLDSWDGQMDVQFLRAGTTWTEKHKQESLEDSQKVTVKMFVPEQYNKFLDVFSEKESH